jgi:putative CocE/NonD family hydrolase
MGDTRDSQAPGNEWRTADDWPVANRATPYYFRNGGGLQTARPSAVSEPIEYTFDPSNPCPTLGGNNLTIARGPRNQNPIESRSDVVLFTTEPLAEPLEVTGRVTAKVFVASSAVDSDLSIRLCDVYPDGKSYNLADGILRLRYHKSLAKPEPLVPGEIYEVEVDCWSTSMVFNRGHRLRVTVTSSNFPRFDVNPGTGKPWVDGEPSVKQTNRIYCDASHPSCIVLPVVETTSKSK